MGLKADIELVSLISVNYFSMKNSALQLFPVAMLLPSWERHILVQENTAKHEEKQKA